MTNKQRLSNKCKNFTDAVCRVGYDRLSDKIGMLPIAKMELAADAMARAQSESIIATFICDAQIAFDAAHPDTCDLNEAIRYA